MKRFLSYILEFLSDIVNGWKGYLLTFAANFVFGILLLCGLALIVNLTFGNARTLPYTDDIVLILMLIILTIFILINIICFKYIFNRSNGAFAHFLNFLLLITGTSLPEIIYAGASPFLIVLFLVAGLIYIFCMAVYGRE